jgi:hypothetical protein
LVGHKIGENIVATPIATYLGALNFTPLTCALG